MVTGKVKLTMGLQKSPSSAHPKGPTQPPPRPKPPLPSPTSGGGGGTNKGSHQKTTVFGRSFGVYFPRSSAQVQPKPPDVSELIRLVEELRERESRLRTELLEQKLCKETAAIVPVLEDEISAQSIEIELRAKRIEILQEENDRLEQESDLLRSRLEEEKREKEKIVEGFRKEVEELKRQLVEVETEKEDKSTTTTTTIIDNNEDLITASQRIQGLIEVSSKSNLIKSLSASKRISKSVDSSISTSSSSSFSSILVGHSESFRAAPEPKSEEFAEADRARHSRSNSEELPGTSDSTLSVVRSRPPRVPKPPPKPLSTGSCVSPSSLSPSSSSSSSPDCQISTEADSIILPPPPAAKSAPPPPPPPPPPPFLPTSKSAPPPPQPPPPPPPPPSKYASLPLAKGSKAGQAKVRRVPEVVEFYHSLMRRDSRRDSGSGVVEVSAASARDLVGEIENRSAYLLAIKTDVETQGDFIRFLIKEVENADFTDIEDVVSFVKWLDDELSYLVDERAVLKHFNWPEKKADALREAAFEYCDLKKLEAEASRFVVVARQPCSSALKKIQTLFEKLEHGLYNLLRLRESASARFKSFHIPVDWMLETGFVSQIKLASVKLAMKYIKRVSAELEVVGGSTEEEELVVQGVKFAFRVHQFAGGFDMETMTAFQELKDKAGSCNHHRHDHH